MDITCVVPTIGNRRAGLLDRALRSIEAQRYPSVSIVVREDVERAGAAATRNEALRFVQTEWVAFLDDDDELYSDHFLRCARYARLSDVDVVYPGYDVDGGEDPVKCFGLPFDEGLLRQRNFIPVTTLCRTEAVLAAGGFQEHPDEAGDPCEDWGLWLAMLDNGATFGHLPLRTWKWHLGPASTKGRPDRW